MSDLTAPTLLSVAERERHYYEVEHPGEAALSLLRSMESIPSHGMPVNLYRHSLQTASRCIKDGASEEMVVVALLHDLGEAFSPANHGAVAAEILRPFVDESHIWLLNNHAVFQEYYYVGQLGGDRFRRDMFRGHEHFELTRRFCEDWDQRSFDPAYQELPLRFFEPMVRRVFSRPRKPAGSAV